MIIVVVVVLDFDTWYLQSYLGPNVDFTPTVQTEYGHAQATTISHITVRLIHYFLLITVPKLKNREYKRVRIANGENNLGDFLAAYIFLVKDSFLLANTE